MIFLELSLCLALFLLEFYEKVYNGENVRSDYHERNSL